MNIFLPYENDIQQCVKALDDLRLNKQILEIYQLTRNAIMESRGEEIRGYKNHPIYIHYKKYIPFMIYYGTLACLEFCRRFDRMHKLHSQFIAYNLMLLNDDVTIDYVPFYVEGAKNKPGCIRTYECVSALYQQKLVNKWCNDKRAPKWTNCNKPNFYITEDKTND